MKENEGLGALFGVENLDWNDSRIPVPPTQPSAWKLQTGRERKKGALISIFIFIGFSLFFWFLLTEAYALFEGDDDFMYIICYGGLLLCAGMIPYSLYLYITTEDSDEKHPEAIKYEQELEQFQLEVEKFKEELEEEAKKQSPFYIGDGSTGSEMKNTCKRCDKIWYLDVSELTDLEERLETSKKLMGQMGNLNMATALFNPALAAQGTTTMAANTSALKSLSDELEQKSRCPECNSKNVERTLVDADNYKQKEERSEKKSDSLSDQLKKLNELKEQGILDEDEFKSAKQKLIEKQ